MTAFDEERFSKNENILRKKIIKLCSDYFNVSHPSELPLIFESAHTEKLADLFFEFVKPETTITSKEFILLLNENINGNGNSILKAIEQEANTIKKQRSALSLIERFLYFSTKTSNEYFLENLEKIIKKHHIEFNDANINTNTLTPAYPYIELSSSENLRPDNTSASKNPQKNQTHGAENKISKIKM